MQSDFGPNIRQLTSTGVSIGRHGRNLHSRQVGESIDLSSRNAGRASHFPHDDGDLSSTPDRQGKWSRNRTLPTSPGGRSSPDAMASIGGKPLPEPLHIGHVGEDRQTGRRMVIVWIGEEVQGAVFEGRRRDLSVARALLCVTHLRKPAPDPVRGRTGRAMLPRVATYVPLVREACERVIGPGMCCVTEIH